eukprot:1161241-Pelagomonas_calceolata.AAC.8
MHDVAKWAAGKVLLPDAWMQFIYYIYCKMKQQGVQLAVFNYQLHWFAGGQACRHMQKHKLQRNLAQRSHLPPNGKGNWHSACTCILIIGHVGAALAPAT